MSAPATYVMPHVECGWCSRVLTAGEGATSHSICEECAPLATEPITPEVVERLHSKSEAAWGMSCMALPADRQSLRAEWRIRSRRFRTALQLMAEDYRMARSAP